MSVCRLREQVRGAFEKLYSFLAGELETAAQQGDTPLQFALMDAWGVSVTDDDHDLLARVRIFNILQVGWVGCWDGLVSTACALRRRASLFRSGMSCHVVVLSGLPI